MAKNLRAKIPEGDTLVIHDVNKEASAKFVKEVSKGVEVVETPRAVAERSVSHSVHAAPCPQVSYDEYVLSMI